MFKSLKPGNEVEPSASRRVPLSYRPTGSSEHHVRTGENWGSVDHALKAGSRGLSGSSTLAQLLARRRGKRNLRNLPPLSVELIREWAADHFRQTGRWPSQTSGPVLAAEGEKWRNVDTALYKGLRGLPGGSSLAQVLKDKKKPRSAERKRQAVPK